MALSLEDLVVVRMRGWSRDLLSWGGDMGLAWVPPSPNLPTQAANGAYAATVFVEATTVAEGRGTTTPFTLLGAPFLNATALAERLNRDEAAAEAEAAEANADRDAADKDGDGRGGRGGRRVPRLHASLPHPRPG